MQEHAICVESVDKHFGRNHVLRDLSFKVATGTTFAFLGRNGTGKTTTIRMLLGMLKPDNGVVRVLGLDPQHDPIKLRASIGYLAEDQAMYGWMRAEEIVSFVAPFYPTWDHELAQRYARQFDVPLKTQIKHLS
ncbi:MAG: ATP-binding cassette domain-containing protein, partial [Planctomycetales bacterium]|nr:ATP-binding cassette domain-containing protein [Planctomycetales bacterium]